MRACRCGRSSCRSSATSTRGWRSAFRCSCRSLAPAQPPSPCTPRSAHAVTATTPEGLSQGTLTITYGGAPNSLGPGSGTGDPNGPATDPIIGDIVAPTGDCRTSDQPATGGYTGTSQPLTNHTTYVGLGEVDVHYALGDPLAQAQLDARVWDVPPTGPAFLMTRGTYRIDALNGYDPAAGDLRLPLFGNTGCWRAATRSGSTSSRSTSRSCAATTS